MSHQWVGGYGQTNSEGLKGDVDEVPTDSDIVANAPFRPEPTILDVYAFPACIDCQADHQNNRRETYRSSERVGLNCRYSRRLSMRA